MLGLTKKLFHALQNIIFPLICPHCQKQTTPASPILCASCFESLELIDCTSRCPTCFTETQNRSKKSCERCNNRHASKERSIDYIASAFDYMGAARCLVQEFKYQDRPYLAKSLAAFLFLQFETLGWPTPDSIVFIPQSFSRWFDRGYNQSKLLAIELGKLLQVEVLEVLKKNDGHISQTLLKLKDRKGLSATAFGLKERASIEDKVLLLIDDVYTTGTTIEKAASALQEGYPKRIYALTLCHAVND